MARYIFCAAILSGFLNGHAEQYRATLRHIEGGGIGYENGYTTLEAFLASDPCQWTAFLDARGHIFNNGRWAANAGGGLRGLWNHRVYGINAYYDFRNTSHLHSNQVGVGLETLGEWWDFRLNGYLPVGTKRSDPYSTHIKGFSGHHLLLSQKFQSAMRGGDAEFGVHFGNFYVGAGPYYFNPGTWGGKARIVGTFRDILALELSNSYDRTFHNKFQGQIAINIPFGESCGCCKLHDRMVQPVGRQEIIVIHNSRRNTPAINPDTGLPYYFVFVNNTSSSNGTYESPYPTLLLAQDNSSPNDIIYVFPGDGTTTGMDSGITLQNSQKFWGSGVSHPIVTTDGIFTIPAHSIASPTITNTNFDTDGNAIDLGTHNAISGFNITSALNDAIFGTDPQNLDVSFCTFTDNATFAIEASFSGDASISITNNQFLNNVNGVFLTLNGTSTVSCLDNIFTGQTSVSNVPFEIASNSNTITALFKDNLFENNTTGTIRLGLTDLISADIGVLNNTITNNGTGAQSILGSSMVILTTGTNDACSIIVKDNTFSENASNALYLHTSGAFTTLDVTLSGNSMLDNGGSGLVIATPVDHLKVVANDNSVIGAMDNGIAIISSGTTLTGDVTLNNNTITDIGNASNGIAINQDFSTLRLTLLNNEINNCEGTGILSFAPTGIDSLTLDISGNTINNCQNLSSNAASGLDIEQFVNFASTVTNNTLLDDAPTAVMIGSALVNPSACLTLTGNNSDTGYLLTNPVGGTFNLTPCDVDVQNIGVINTSGTIDLVQSCSTPIPCPP